MLQGIHSDIPAKPTGGRHASTCTSARTIGPNATHAREIPYKPCQPPTRQQFATNPHEATL